MFLLALLLATRVCGEASVQGQDKKWMESHMQELQKSINIDWDDPPTGHVTTIEEPSCAAWWTPTCTTTKFEIAHKLTKAGKQGAPKYRIYPVVGQQKGPENNFGSTPITINVEKAKASIDTTSRGWNAGAQLSLPFGSSGGSVSLSASYHEEHTAGTTKTTSEGARWECPPGHRCEIQSWTLHLEVAGVCHRIPAINRCGSEIDPCSDPDLGCDQYIAFKEKECPGSGGHRQEACTVRTPLIDHNGAPVTENVYVMTELKVAPAPKIVNVLGDWLKLDNGKSFNPVTETFKDSSGGKEYAGKDEPRPDIPEGTKVVRVEGSRLLLNDGRWLDGVTGKTTQPQTPRVVGFRDGGWLVLSNDEFYRPETDEFWHEENGAPYRSPTLLPPAVPSGTVAEGVSNGWVKVKDGGWIDPDFGRVVPRNTTAGELQRLGIVHETGGNTDAKGGQDDNVPPGSDWDGSSDIKGDEAHQADPDPSHEHPLPDDDGSSAGDGHSYRADDLDYNDGHDDNDGIPPGSGWDGSSGDINGDEAHQADPDTSYEHDPTTDHDGALTDDGLSYRAGDAPSGPAGLDVTGGDDGYGSFDGTYPRAGGAEAAEDNYYDAESGPSYAGDEDQYGPYNVQDWGSYDDADSADRSRRDAYDAGDEPYAFLEPDPFVEPDPFAGSNPDFIDPDPDFAGPGPYFHDPDPSFNDPDPGFIDPDSASFDPDPAFIDPDFDDPDPFVDPEPEQDFYMNEEGWDSGYGQDGPDDANTFDRDPGYSMDEDSGYDPTPADQGNRETFHEDIRGPSCGAPARGGQDMAPDYGDEGYNNYG